MVDEWPLVGRAAELDQVRKLLRGDAGGVVLAGPAGVGKSRLATEALALAGGRGFVPVRVMATQASARLPFGAFAPLLPDLTLAERADVLRQVARAIAALGGGKPVALLVDDAHLLDESSAALTHQLAATGAVFIIATVRSGEPASDAVVGLWKEGLAERIELAPLSRDQVETLLAATLDGPADGMTTQLLWTRTDGNALYLRELVLGGLEAGVLRQDGGVWRLHGKLPASTRLVELVEARLGGLGESERTVLEVVALGEPLGVEVVEPVGDHGALEDLERRGLLQVQQDGRRFQARLAHPLYAEVLQSRLSPLRARTTARLLADAIERAGTRRREDLLRVATWRLAEGGRFDADLMLGGAHEAYIRSDPELAARLVGAARQAGGGFGAGLLLGRILCETGRGREAEAVLTELLPEADSDAKRASLAIAMAETANELGRIADAARIAEQAEATIADPQARHQVAACRIMYLYFSEQVTDARTLSEALLTDASGEALFRAASFGTILLARTGRVTDAMAATERGSATYAALGDAAPPWRRLELSAAHCHVLLHAGRLLESEALATEEHAHALAAGWTWGQANFSWTLMVTFLAQGRIRSAVHWGRIAAALYRNLGHRSWLGWTLPYLAHALALAGQAEEADDALSEYEATLEASGDFEFDRTERLRAQAWLAVARRDLSTAHALLREMGDLAHSWGEWAVEGAALHDLARLGEALEVSPRLGELVTVVEGPLAPVLAGHAEAMRTSDPARLGAVSASFEDLGALLLAAEAAADAAVAWRRRGDPRKATAAERRAGALAGRCEGARTPALTAVTARAALTARELEIARLAAAGVPNKEIAARLYLSLHTVQNKLHSAYEKLGIEGRAELPDALEGY